MGVGILRKILHEAAIRFAVLRDEGSSKLLENSAEEFGIEKRRSRIRREKWKERRETRNVGNGVDICRVQGCPNPPQYRPVLLFPPLDGGADRIRVETAMLDVCEHHARMLGPETYTENPDVWRAVTNIFREAQTEPPDPDLAEIEYVKVRENA